MTLDDRNIIEKFIDGKFDETDYNHIMALVYKIERIGEETETTKKNMNIWFEVSPNTTKITIEERLINGERKRYQDGHFKGLFLPHRHIVTNNKDKRTHIINACVEFIKKEWFKY